MRYIIGLMVAGVILFLIFGKIVASIYSTCVFVLGSAISLVIYFFQYYLWTTTAGNIIVAAVVLLAASYVVYRVFTAQTRHLLTKNDFDEALQKKVISHVIDEVKKGSAIAYSEPVSATLIQMILRIFCWVLIVATVLVLVFFELSYGPSLSSLIYLGLGAVLTLFMVLRFVFTKPLGAVVPVGPVSQNPIIQDGMKICPKCREKNKRTASLCKSCGAYL